MEQHNETRKDFIKKSFAGTIAATALFAGAGAILESFKERESSIATPVSNISAGDFRSGVMPRAQLSMQASQIAVEKLSQANAKEFATYELLEAIAVIDVLKDLGTTVPPMSEDGQAFIKKLNNLEGLEFDKTYMQAELSNHEFLRDLAKDYLNSAAGNGSSDKETRRLATVALFAFKEHVAISKRVYGELTA